MSNVDFLVDFTAADDSVFSVTTKSTGLEVVVFRDHITSS